MKPDRSNYEIWIVDWLDGKLDEARCSELMEFLEKNPDLKEEFDSLAVTRLTPTESNFSQKEKLIRSASELPVSQVEYLSLAYFEKDITAEQLSDLELNISLNPENKKIFESIQRTRLLPPRAEFKNKNLLKKHLTGSRVLRLSLAAMSAAATIAILVLSYVFIRHSMAENEIQSALIVNPDTAQIEPFIVRTTALFAQAEKQVPLKIRAEASDRLVIDSISDRAILPLRQQKDIDMLAIMESHRITGVSVLPSPAFGKPHGTDILIASNNTFIIPDFEDGRSRLSKFIARTFREKLLKDDSYNETPLKTYEIAEAGIEGLNKLLGWEMALVKTNDEEGNLKSVYFSSKVLKFNAPVKKQELSQ